MWLGHERSEKHSNKKKPREAICSYLETISTLAAKLDAESWSRRLSPSRIAAGCRRIRSVRLIGLQNRRK